MKKMLTAAFAALALMGSSARPASAGVFGLIPHTGCGCCGCNFCVRQYNAFSPVCCGTVYCDGCCPIGCGGPGCFNYMGFPSCGPWGNLDSTTCGTTPMTPAVPVPATPATPIPQNLPNALPKGPPSAAAGYGQPGVYSAGYWPAFYSGYGYGYAPQAPVYGTGTVPAYWNGR
jgi:hypothetical protein